MAELLGHLGIARVLLGLSRGSTVPGIMANLSAFEAASLSHTYLACSCGVNFLSLTKSTSMVFGSQAGQEDEV